MSMGSWRQRGKRVKMGLNGSEMMAEFSKCPNCGSENRMGKKLAEQYGEAQEGVIFGVINERTVIANPNKAGRIIGATVPAAMVLADVCLDCGTIFAVRCEKTEARIMPADQGQKKGPF